MYKKIVFIFIFSIFGFGYAQINAATKNCKSFYDDHKLIFAQLKEHVAKHREKIAEKSEEIQEKYKKDLKSLEDMMASLETRMSKMDAKVNPASETKKLKYSLSRCKGEKAKITKLISKIEKVRLKLDKELDSKISHHEYDNLKKDMAEKSATHHTAPVVQQPSHEPSKEGFWDRVKKLF